MRLFKARGEFQGSNLSRGHVTTVKAESVSQSIQSFTCVQLSATP